MDTRYDHTQEKKTYQLWQDAKAFNPDSNQKSNVAKSFSIMMPPPNANDALHVGHAMFISLEDVMIRFHRLLGDDTLWLPGTDHAGIETQYLFEKKLKKEGKSRFNFDRQTLYNMIAEYVSANSDVAVNQMKEIGASADWSRFMFMLDDKIVSQVTATFKKMHDDGLVYRDERLVNYCTNCGTSYSELEVDYVERIDPLYYVKYFFAPGNQPNDWEQDYIVVATTRPEPIFADTHLAVNPKHQPTQALIGKKVLNPLTNQPMEIIADAFVDPEFGTGIVKLTPAHDQNDFAVAQTHQLPIIKAIDTNGKITQLGGEFAGLKVAEARKQVVAKLTASGHIDKIDDKYSHRVGICYRCGRVIEPLPYPQFFLKVKPLTDRVLKAFDEGDFKVMGAGHDKILRYWLTNLKDWNISRQIVWGIRIPVWYDISEPSLIQVSFINAAGEYQTGNLAEILKLGTPLAEIEKGLQSLNANAATKYVVSKSKPGGDSTYLPETDTFDTWFSSGQWPITTLKANQPGDFDRFYPTSVMETAYDILMFWVMRMLMFGYYLTNQTPFKLVYLHGLVRDAQGKKMSKSKGNVVNPLSVIEKYGADALRMALIIRSTPGIDKAVGEHDFKAMRNFTNKIWNACRFLQMNLDSLPETGSSDQEFKTKLAQVSQDITQQLNDSRIGLAAETAYNEFWHWFCDISIEDAKAGKLSKTAVLEGLKTFLILLHPFVPFVTENCWQEIKENYPKDSQLLALNNWPTSSTGN